MPKRGARLPWRVEYAYPPSERAPQGVSGAEARHNEDEARDFAAVLARRGASGVVRNRDTNAVVHTFGPTAPEDDDA